MRLLAASMAATRSLAVRMVEVLDIQCRYGEGFSGHRFGVCRLARPTSSMNASLENGSSDNDSLATICSISKNTGSLFSAYSSLTLQATHSAEPQPALPADDHHLFVTDIAAKHGRRLRRFLAARLRNASDVGDLAQEVFLRLLRVERHDQIRCPEAYLLTIASHVLHQHALDGATVPEPVDITEALVDARLAEENDPVAQLHLERRLEALDRALARLSPKTRAVFVLQRRDGHTIDEIAARLDISRAMVKKYLAKAVVQCSRQLHEKK